MKLIISEKLESKRKQLCAVSPRNEWSGFVYYTYNKENDTIIAMDMILMDVGEPAHTSIVPNEKVVLYKIQNCLTHCHVGLIHSHNIMRAYFSHEDMGTIQSEIKEEYPYFLSIVVNNAGDIVGKFAQKGEKVQEITIIEKQYLVEKNEKVLVNTEEKKEVHNIATAVITDLSVERPNIEIDDVLKDFGELAHIKIDPYKSDVSNSYNINLLNLDTNVKKEENKKPNTALPKLSKVSPFNNTVDTLVLKMISGISWITYVSVNQIEHYLDSEIIKKTVGKLDKNNFINYCSYVIEIDLDLTEDILKKIKELMLNYKSKEATDILQTIYDAVCDYTDDPDDPNINDYYNDI